MYVCRCSLSIVTLLIAYKTEHWYIDMLIEILRKPTLVPFDPTNIRCFLQIGREIILDVLGTRTCAILNCEHVRIWIIPEELISILTIKGVTLVKSW